MTETPAKTHDGKVVSVAGDKLTTTCSEGKQHCHTVAKDAKVTCDGQGQQGCGPEGRHARPGDHAQGRQDRGDGRRIRKTHSGAAATRRSGPGRLSVGRPAVGPRILEQKDLTTSFALGKSQRCSTVIEASGSERELREANRLMHEFLAVLAREPRNPLAAIRSALNVFGQQGNDAPR